MGKCFALCCTLLRILRASPPCRPDIVRNTLSLYQMSQTLRYSIIGWQIACQISVPRLAEADLIALIIKQSRAVART